MPIRRDQSTDEIAGIFSVNPQTVRTWIADGCPHTRRKGAFLLNDGEVQDWIKKNNRQTTPGRPPKQDKSQQPLEGDKDYWLARKYRNQCLRDEGELIPADEVQQTVSSLLATFRNRLSGGAAVLAVRMEGRDSAERQDIISKFHEELLSQLAGDIRSLGRVYKPEGAADPQ